ncbi:MAG: helix-turn-helix domain-containing protein [Chitinophagaceae bacterium]
MQIGDKIRKVRELKGLKQETIAQKLGMSVTAYGNLERGESSLSFDRLEEIAAAMEVSVSDIINIPEQLNIHQVTNSQFGFNYYDHRPASPAELEGYKMAIAELQKQNEHLKAQVEKLTDALIGKK